MANTTWSTTDKSAGITLSNANLTASGGTGSVRSVDRQLSGKFYWEYTFVTVANNPGVGIATIRADLASFYANATSGVLVYASSPIYVNGVNSGVNLGAISVGGIVGVALDLTNNLIWMRSGVAGNWNANAANNPATGVGGLSIAAFAGGGIPAYAATAIGTGTITANFGNTAFAGAVPVGFTSGFTSGATPPLNMLDTQAAVEDWRTPSNPDMRATQVAVEDWRVPIPDAQVTQVLAEHWYSHTNPDIQVTQVLLEHWATAASGTVQAIATQVLLEHWATVASVVVPPPATGGPIVTMIH